MSEQTTARNECFISLELRGGIGYSVCAQYCWFCSAEQAYHLWKHWRPTASLQIINMHGNQYIFGSGGEKNWEKHRKRTEALVCSSSFITVIYSLSLFSFSCTCARFLLPTQTHPPTHTRARAAAKMWTQQKRGSEGICPDQQIIYSFLSDHPCGLVHCVSSSVLFLQLARLCVCHRRAM